MWQSLDTEFKVKPNITLVHDGSEDKLANNSTVMK